MMKLGIIKGYGEDSFRYAKAHQLDFLEICSNYDHDSQAFLQAESEIKNRIQRYGLPVLSVGRWNSLPIKEGHIDRDVVELLKKQIQTTASIGCPVFHLGVNRDQSVTLYQNYVLAVEYLREMCGFAGEKGVTLSLYNCSWENFLCESKAWDIVLPELPQMMLKYDCSHSYGRGADYLAELYQWAPRVVHMHVKGTSMIGSTYVDDPPAGLDALNWRRIFSILYAKGYDKTLSIEPHSSVWQGELGEKGVQFTIQFIRPFLMR